MSSFGSLLKTEWRLLGFGFLMMFFSSPGQTYFIALFSGEIRQDLGLSHGEFGAIYSAATLISAFLLLWTGSFIDKIDLPKVSVVVVVCLACGAVLISQSQGIVMLFLAILALRQFGQGLMSMTSSTAMMRYVELGRGKANSIAGMGYSVAEAVVPSIIVAALLVLGWRQLWLMVALVLVLVVPFGVSCFLLNHKKRHQSFLERTEMDDGLLEPSEDSTSATDHAKKQWTRSEVVRDPYFYLFVPGVLSQSMLYTGFMFHQIHLVTEKQWSLTLWASLYALFSLVAICSNLTTGYFIDRIGALRIAPFVTLPMGIGLVVLSSSNSSLIAAAFLFLMGISTGMQAAITAPFFAERYGSRHFASIKSLATFAMVFMSALSPVALGWFIDLGISINRLAFFSAVYAGVTILLAYYAYIKCRQPLGDGS